MKYMHPYTPKLLFKFLQAQSRGKRFIINALPPIKEIFDEKKD